MKSIMVAALCLAGSLQLMAQEPLQDWAGLERYQEDNKMVQGPVKAVFMGNSITDGWPVADPDFFTQRDKRAGFCTDVDAFPSGCDCIESAGRCDSGRDKRYCS